MRDLFDDIMQSVAILGIQVAEEDLEADLDTIADAVSDAFWNGTDFEDDLEEDDYERAYDSANETLSRMLEELPYIAEFLERRDWDESDEYDSFRELVTEEVFERADLPMDEEEFNERLAENEELENDDFEEDDFEEGE